MNRIWKLTPPDDANSSDINDLRTRSHADRRSDPRPKHSHEVIGTELTLDVDTSAAAGGWA